ncbi:MAG: hypothetical protein J6A00_06505 [Bacteroides sp.]|nr:hypothetical protein [Bacteroidaceae bacterium]MBO5507397.1 hypothetical protein [Bacteroides sp.]
MEDYAGMTPEELIEVITETEGRLEAVSLERDSLRDENTTLSNQIEAANKELSETKKLNYTLARQIDRKPHEEDFDSILINLYGNSRKGN